MNEFTAYGDEFDEALHNLDKVLEHCIQTYLCLSTDNCHMMMTEGIVLGHYLSVTCIQVVPTNVEVILRIPTPKT